MSIDAGVRIGHVHLKVANLERAITFYHGVLGFDVVQRLGDAAAFLSAGGYHHHIGLNTWESLDGSHPGPGTTGLYHTAILYPSRASLADAFRRVVSADDNGVELYCDKPKDVWPHKPDGSLAMYTRPLDLEKLLAE